MSSGDMTRARDMNSLYTDCKVVQNPLIYKLVWRKFIGADAPNIVQHWR
jgi:hypothetical protein